MNALTTSRQRGFTMVELLVTVTIIAMLAAVVLGAVSASRETARKAKTKATITKLHAIIMERYDSYRTRRVPINTFGMNPNAAAQARLVAIRDLMRLEMPERDTDVRDDPIAINPATGLRIARPAISNAFRRRLLTSPPGNSTYDSAEYLYLIVSMAGARDQFQDSEIGDVDQDGWKEFVDGWGNPIEFLRWAPGFMESDIQARTFSVNASPPPPFAPDSALVSEAATNDHDPFDSRKVHAEAYRLVPLIYSAGPDGIYDIDRDRFYRFAGDPYAKAQAGDPYFPASGQPNFSGAPIDSDNISATATGPKNGSLDHYDNIHNHRLEAD